MTDSWQLLAWIILEKDFRAKIKQAISDGKLAEYVKKGGFNVDTEYLEKLKNLNMDDVENMKVKDLHDELLGNVGIEPCW